MKAPDIDNGDLQRMRASDHSVPQHQGACLKDHMVPAVEEQEEDQPAHHAKRKPGRPSLPPDDKKSRGIRVNLTSAQVAALDAQRGRVPRSEYLARCAGLMPDPNTSGTP